MPKIPHTANARNFLIKEIFYKGFYTLRKELNFPLNEIEGLNYIDIKFYIIESEFNMPETNPNSEIKTFDPDNFIYIKVAKL